MIDKLTYDEILSISKDLKEQIKIINSIIDTKDLPQLKDFSATVEGYSKFLENTIEINKDADKALEDLASRIK
ncbi:MAG: hypothetical protein HFJ11_02520 [Bacilli bacterium]|nr:hypothetical protein [Bacilli bacterium]